MARVCACALAGEPELQEREGGGEEVGRCGALIQRGREGAAAAPVARRAQGDPARDHGGAGAATWGQSGPDRAPAGQHPFLAGCWLGFQNFLDGIA